MIALFNKARIVAFDKIASKITKMINLCNKLNATSVEVRLQDATKIGRISLLIVP